MIPANQSFYQMSTPLGDHKKRRLSANPVSRLSVIPCELERSFANNELDPPDFEVWSMSLHTIHVHVLYAIPGV